MPIETGPTGSEQNDSSAESSKVTNQEAASSNLELSAEQQAEIDRKREAILNSENLAFRFVNSSEYFKLLESDQTLRQLETITEPMFDFMYCWEIFSPLGAVRTEKLGRVLRHWSAAAEEKTKMFPSARALGENVEIYSMYRQLRKEVREKGGNPEEAKTIFANRLKGETANYLRGVYAGTKVWRELCPNKPLPEDPYYSVWGWNYWEHKYGEDPQEVEEASPDLSFDTSVRLLQYSNKVIKDEHREKLSEIMSRKASDLSRSDMRFLMRFAKGNVDIGFREDQIDNPDLKSGTNLLPYEMVLVWPADVSKADINFWNEDMGFTAIPKNTPTSKMLGVIVLSHYDKEYFAEIVQRMAGASKDNPEKAHLIIDPKMYEFFPKKGTDFEPPYNPEQKDKK